MVARRSNPATAAASAGGELRHLGPAWDKLWFELDAAACNLTGLAIIQAAAAWSTRADAPSHADIAPGGRTLRPSGLTLHLALE